MSLKAMIWAWKLKLPRTHKLVLMALADPADEDGFAFLVIATSRLNAA